MMSASFHHATQRSCTRGGEPSLCGGGHGDGGGGRRNGGDHGSGGDLWSLVHR